MDKVTEYGSYGFPHPVKYFKMNPSYPAGPLTKYRPQIRRIVLFDKSVMAVERSKHFLRHIRESRRTAPITHLRRHFLYIVYADQTKTGRA